MSPDDTDELVVASDSRFQAELRARQSAWREREGLPIGSHNGRPLGSRLAMPWAEEHLANYLTPSICDVVRREVIEPAHDQRKLYSRPRIFDDLLSSQPLCFNLFGELAADTAAATAVGRRLWPSRVAEVTSIEFEWSPGRGDLRYLGNRSAFDVMVLHRTPSGGHGFIGIEMKYHENLRGKAATHRQRYSEVATASGVFADPDSPEYRRSPLQQIWLDHLLALSMLQVDDAFDAGLFVFVHPEGNEPCQRAGDRYRATLTDSSTFEQRTLEGLIAAIRSVIGPGWIDAVADRYLAPGRLAD